MSAPTPIATSRLFIAITLPDAVREVLLQLPERIAGVAWSKPDQWHLTLRFLGDVPDAQIEPMVKRLTEIAIEPFILPIEGVGTFPPNRPPRVVWVGTGSGHPRLFQLRQRIDDAVLGAGLDVDVRIFHPHITLARCNENLGTALSHWLHAHRDFLAPPFRVQSFDLYRSELLSSGAVHTLTHHFPLEVRR